MSLRTLVLPGLAVVALGGLLAATVVEPAPDVAYYLLWSRFPDLGYLDHPGAVAWPFLAVPTAWLRPAAWGVAGVVAGLHALLVADVLRRCGANRDVAVALFCAPLWIGGVLLWTPDVPLLVAWHAGLWVLLHDDEGERRAAPWLVICAVAVTAAKIIGVWLVLLWCVAAWRRPAVRRWALAALAASIGVWLATGLESTMFQLARTGGVASQRSALQHLAGPLEVLGGQLAIGGPALAVALLAGAWHHRKAPPVTPHTTSARRHTLAVLAVGTAAPFVLGGFVTRIEPNWLAPMWLPLVGWLLAVRGGAAIDGRLWRRAAWAQLALLAVLVGWLAVAPVLPIGRDPLARLRGWQAWSDQFPRAELVLADRYQWSSVIALHHGIESAATFGALAPGSAVRPGALDTHVELDAPATVLVVWSESEPPSAALAARWPAVLSAGVVAAPGGGAAPARTHWELRGR